MANYYATARSNYFKVKDTKKFEKFCNKVGVEMVTQNDLVGFICSRSENGSLPSAIYNDGDWEDIDLCDMIASHLCRGQVAVMMEVGAVKHRYVNGYAVAVNWKGEVKEVSLDMIYDLAKKLGVKNVTKAEY